MFTPSPFKTLSNEGIDYVSVSPRPDSVFSAITLLEYVETWVDFNGKPCAAHVRLTPKGKYEKHRVLAKFRFTTFLSRDAWMEGLLKAAEETLRYNAEKKARNTGKEAKVGTIVYSTWGYEQTNVDFYEVVKVSGRRITLRELDQTRREDGFMSGLAMPMPGQYRSEEITKMAKFDGAGKLSFSIRHGWASEWDGSPKSYSSYA